MTNKRIKKLNRGEGKQINSGRVFSPASQCSCSCSGLFNGGLND